MNFSLDSRKLRAQRTPEPWRLSGDSVSVSCSSCTSRRFSVDLVTEKFTISRPFTTCNPVGGRSYYASRDRWCHFRHGYRWRHVTRSCLMTSYNSVASKFELIHLHSNSILFRILSSTHLESRLQSVLRTRGWRLHSLLEWITILSTDFHKIFPPLKYFLLVPGDPRCLI